MGCTGLATAKGRLPMFSIRMLAIGLTGGLAAAALATPAGAASYKLLYSFGNNDAASPYAALINIGDTLYGTTTSGGTDNLGAVFRIATTAGPDKLLHSFSGFPHDGDEPEASLVDVAGMLFGTTFEGGLI